MNYPRIPGSMKEYELRPPSAYASVLSDRTADDMAGWLVGRGFTEVLVQYGEYGPSGITANFPVESADIPRTLVIKAGELLVWYDTGEISVESADGFLPKWRRRPADDR